MSNAQPGEGDIQPLSQKFFGHNFDEMDGLISGDHEGSPWDDLPSPNEVINDHSSTFGFTIADGGLSIFNRIVGYFFAEDSYRQLQLEKRGDGLYIRRNGELFSLNHADRVTGEAGGLERVTKLCWVALSQDGIDDGGTYEDGDPTVLSTTEAGRVLTAIGDYIGELQQFILDNFGGGSGSSEALREAWAKVKRWRESAGKK